MSDFAPGDLVVCVDDAPFRRTDTRPSIKLARGRVYRVSRFRLAVGQHGAHVLVDNEPVHGVNEHGFIGWGSGRFRKLNDGTDDAALIARIKSCRPVRQGEPA